MSDKRLRDYLFERGYVIDCTQGAIEINPSKLCPLVINGKIVDYDLIVDGKIIYEGLSLEEFLEWESFHCVEG